jgi:hypothetical protein
MAISRRALSDSFVALFMTLSIWLFLDIILNKGNIIKKCFFVASFTLSILSKESSVIFLAPFLVYSLVHKFKYQGKIKMSELFFIFASPIALTAFVYLNLSGGFSNILSVARIILTSPATNKYAFLYGSGPWFRYVIDYILLSPWVMLLSLGYIYYLLLNLKNIDSIDTYFLVIMITSFILFNLFTKNLRYIMVLDMPIRLFAVSMMCKLIQIGNKRLKFIIISIAVLLICVSDFILFNKFFVKKDLYDPTSVYLLKIRRIIP